MTIKHLQDVNSSDYDLTFVGSGASTSYSIIALCEQYLNSDSKSLRVLVVEASSEFCTGVAYGYRSGNMALILTRLDQFYPPDELMRFVKWVREQECEQDIWENENQEYIQQLKEMPLATFAATLGQKCVKRRLVGAFITWRVNQAILGLPSASGLRIHFINALAISLYRKSNVSTDSSIMVALRNSEDAESHTGEFRTRKLVLAVGSRPRQALNVHGVAPEKWAPRIIHDPYGGNGLDANLQNMLDSLHTQLTGTVKILILGSNASAMESIYLLCNWSKKSQIPIEIVAVSTIGNFPAKIPEFADTKTVAVPEIDDYITRGTISSDGLYSAALAGLNRLKIQGESLDCYNRSIDVALLKAITAMSDEMRLEFIREKCNALGRYKRRAESLYYGTVMSMIGSGFLTIQSARVNNISVNDTQMAIQIEEPDGRTSFIDVHGAINCGACEPLNTHNSNPLIASLVSSNTASVDISGTCFKTVNGGFAVAEGIYLMGPLLAGNIVNGEPVWHLEHCGRIINFSKALVQEVLGS